MGSQRASHATLASLVALVVESPPANTGDIRDMVSIPGSEGSPGGWHCNPLQYFAEESPWTEEPDGPQSMGLQRVGHD